MPYIPFLARTARQPPGMEEDGALLPRDGQGLAHSDRGGEGAGARDAGELPGDVLTVLGAAGFVREFEHWVSASVGQLEQDTVVAEFRSKSRGEDRPLRGQAVASCCAGTDDRASSRA